MGGASGGMRVAGPREPVARRLEGCRRLALGAGHDRGLAPIEQQAPAALVVRVEQVERGAVMLQRLFGRVGPQRLLGRALRVAYPPNTIAAVRKVKSQLGELLRAGMIRARLQSLPDDGMEAPPPRGGYLGIQAFADLVVAERVQAGGCRVDESRTTGLDQALLDMLQLLPDHLREQRRIECSADDRRDSQQIDNRGRQPR